MSISGETKMNKKEKEILLLKTIKKIREMINLEKNLMNDRFGTMILEDETAKTN